MLTFNYFPVRGRLETTKLMLAYKSIPYNENIVTFEEWFSGAKANKEISHFGQIPSMQLPNGKLISQSGAIVRYVAKLADLYPTDIETAAEADMVFEMCQDMNPNPLINWHPYQSEAWIKANTDYFNALPNKLDAAKLILGDKVYFSGDAPHYGDFAFLHTCLQVTFLEPSCLAEYPTLVTWVGRMMALPNVATYVQGRPPNAAHPVWGREGSLIHSGRK